MSINQIARIESFSLDGNGAITGYTPDVAHTYAFDSILGNETVTERPVELIQHKGIQGHIVRVMPPVGRPFPMIAQLHTELIEDWFDLLRLYQTNLKGTGAPRGVMLRRHDTEYLWPLDVLSVQKVSHHRATGGVGTLVDGAAQQVGGFATFRFLMIAREIG